MNGRVTEVEAKVYGRGKNVRITKIHPKDRQVLVRFLMGEWDQRVFTAQALRRVLREVEGA